MNDNSPVYAVLPIRRDRLALACALATALGVLLFAFFTKSVWEDYYITFRSSRNLVDGLGLVYHPGDRLHTFTSPLGVLLPALAYVLTGNEDGALWLFRVFSALALGASAWVLVGALRSHGWSRVACVFATLLGLFTLKNLEFASNGMESAFLVFFTLLALTELVREKGPRVGRLGVAFGGLMWTRPDAFVIAGGLAVGSLLFSDADDRRLLWRRGLAAVALGVVIYLPWVVFAALYYGSPVPHTITAKAPITPAGFDLARILLTPLRCLATNGTLTETFAPDYWRIQQWGPDWHNLWGALARIAAFAWLWPRLPRVARLASFATLVGGVYLEQVSAYPWYFPPFCALGGVAFAGFCATGWRATATPVRLGLVTATLSGLVVLIAGGVTASMRQKLVEEDVRAAAGRWLREHARQGDTVLLEPTGYIGYHATDRVRITDFPGLVSRESAAAVASGAKTFAQLVPTLKPAWLVLRPHEVLDPELVATRELKEHYVHRASFSRIAEIQAAGYLPGRSWMLYDGEFHIFERKRESDTP